MTDTPPPRELEVRKLPSRHPGEDRQVEIITDVLVKQGHREPRKWRYVFRITDWTDSTRLDGEGLHATLRTIYTYTEDGCVETVAVNGGTRVPAFVRDAVAESMEIEGFGRPPFIPERDGDFSGSNPRPRKVGDSDD